MTPAAAAADEERVEELLPEGTSRFVARLGPDHVPALGDRLTLAVDTRKLHFFDATSGEALHR